MKSNLCIVSLLKSVISSPFVALSHKLGIALSFFNCHEILKKTRCICFPRPEKKKTAATAHVCIQKRKLYTMSIIHVKCRCKLTLAIVKADTNEKIKAKSKLSSIFSLCVCLSIRFIIYTM